MRAAILSVQDVKPMEGFGQLAYANETLLSPFGLGALCVAAAAMFVAPRRYAFLPVFVLAALIPSSQRISIVTLDFTFLRILIVLGAIRTVLNHEFALIRWNILDRCFVSWSLCGAAVCVIRDPSSLIYNCGQVFDMLGIYYLSRAFIRSLDDMSAVASVAAIVSIPLAAAFYYESATARNLFAVFGGVREITQVREGKLRCGGPYSHPILAGCFWASILPLIAARWWAVGRGKLESVIGISCGLLIIYFCSSSTPVLGLGAALIGAAAFTLRNRMRSVRWALLIVLVCLHLVMQKPVWHLISRVSAVGGSTGYFRFQLIDNFIRRVDEWGLIGTKSTAHWFWGGQDICNQFVMEGVRGGLLTFGLFVAMIALAFGGVGRLWRTVEWSRAHMALSWALGVSLLTHCACFFGVSYFGQTTMLWYMTIGVIAGLSPFGHASIQHRASSSRLATGTSGGRLLAPNEARDS